MGKSCSFGLQYVFCTMSKENNSLNMGNLHNCRLYYNIEIDIRVCVHVVRMLKLTEGLFDKSRMKQPDIFEAMKSMNFMLAPSAGHTFGIGYTNVARKSFISQEHYRYAEHTLA